MGARRLNGPRELPKMMKKGLEFENVWKVLGCAKLKGMRSCLSDARKIMYVCMFNLFRNN